MTETKDTADKTLRGAGRKPLSLQRTVESGHVRQSFSHGRSKSVVVEKRKTRKLAAPGAEAEVAPAPVKAPAVEVKAPEKAPVRPEPKAESAKGDLLRPEERDARARALAEARKQQAIEEEALRVEQAKGPPPEAAISRAGRASRAGAGSRSDGREGGRD